MEEACGWRLRGSGSAGSEVVGNSTPGGRGLGPEPQEVSGCRCCASVVLRKRPREARVSAHSCF